MFGNIFRRKRILEARIGGIQRSLESWNFAAFLQLDLELQKEYDDVLLQEELLWY